jgi:hypothetical protein
MFPSCQLSKYAYLNNLLQIPSTFSRVECSSSAVDETELVRQLRNQISQLNKDMIGLHAMVAVVKMKSKLATVVEQHAMDRLRVATESLSCKQYSPSCSPYFSS